MMMTTTRRWIWSWAAGDYTFGLPNGGFVSVTIDDDLNIASFDISSPEGWTWDIEHNESDRLRIEFENGDDTEIEIDIRVRDDHLEVEIDD